MFIEQKCIFTTRTYIFVKKMTFQVLIRTVLYPRFPSTSVFFLEKGGGYDTAHGIVSYPPFCAQNPETYPASGAFVHSLN